MQPLFLSPTAQCVALAVPVPPPSGWTTTVTRASAAGAGGCSLPLLCRVPALPPRTVHVTLLPSVWEFCLLCCVLLFERGSIIGVPEPQGAITLWVLSPQPFSLVGWVGQAGEAAIQKHHASLVLWPLMSPALPKVEAPRTPQALLGA